MTVFKNFAAFANSFRVAARRGMRVGAAQERDLASLCEDAGLVGVPFVIARQAYEQAMELARVAVCRSISEALADGDDPLEVARAWRWGARAMSDKDAIADVVERMNDGRLSVGQARGILHLMGLSTDAAHALTKQDDCVLVWIDDEDGDRVGQIEAPESMTMDEARGVLRRASERVSNPN